MIKPNVIAARVSSNVLSSVMPDSMAFTIAAIVAMPVLAPAKIDAYLIRFAFSLYELCCFVYVSMSCSSLYSLKRIME